MKLYRFILSFKGRMEVLNLIVEAKDHMDAITSGIHTYRLSVPECIKKMDVNDIECYEITGLEDVWKSE